MKIIWSKLELEKLELQAFDRGKAEGLQRGAAKYLKDWEERQKTEYQFIISKYINYLNILKNEGLNHADELCEEINMVRNIVFEDVRSTILSNLFYDSFYNFDSSWFPWFPDFTDLSDSSKGTMKKVRLAFDKVVTFPWSKSKLNAVIKNIKKGEFQFQENDQRGIYYEGIGITVILSGMHSITRGIQLQEGEITVPKYDCTLMFEKFCVNAQGTSYVDIKTSEKIMKVPDFRIGLIYELSRIEYEIKKMYQ